MAQPAQPGGRYRNSLGLTIEVQAAIRGLPKIHEAAVRLTIHGSGREGEAAGQHPDGECTVNAARGQSIHCLTSLGWIGRTQSWVKLVAPSQSLLIVTVDVSVARRVIHRVLGERLRQGLLSDANAVST